MTRRPRYVEASTIGSWMSVLQCLSVVAVITNSMMVGFTSTVLVHDIDLFSHISDRYQEAGLWVCVMAMEHLLLLAKVLLAMFVPDESQATRINKARLANFMDARQRCVCRLGPNFFLVFLCVSFSGGGGGGKRFTLGPVGTGSGRSCKGARATGSHRPRCGPSTIGSKSHLCPA